LAAQSLALLGVAVLYGRSWLQQKPSTDRV
jgi:hypothetical protein